MAKSFDLLIQECDQMIRTGRAAEVSTRLANLNAARIQRKWRLPLATICRRAGLVALGLRILTPLMNLEKKIGVPSPGLMEQAEYAVLLERCGAVSEGLRRLEALDPSETPEIHLYRSFCHFKSWNYEAAMPELLAYVEKPLKPYARLVGQVNLAATLNQTGRLKEAWELLREIHKTASDQGHNRLLANTLELMSEVAIKSGEEDKAEQFLAQAARLFGDAPVQDRLFIEMWQTYLSCRKSGSAQTLLALREVAFKSRHFESAREIDLLALQIHFDIDRFQYLIAGTPYSCFRARILKDLQREAPTGRYLYGTPSTTTLELNSGTLSRGNGLQPGQGPHRVLSILLKDFYKPTTIAGLFSELFPDEQFNIVNSPNRVRQLIHRLGGWTRVENVPLEICRRGTGYQVAVTGALQIAIDSSGTTADATTRQIEILYRSLAGRDGFTIHEASEQSRFSPSVVRRLIQRAQERGLISKFGASTNTRYYFLRAA